MFYKKSKYFIKYFTLKYFTKWYIKSISLPVLSHLSKRKKRRKSLPQTLSSTPCLSFTQPIIEIGHNLFETVLQIIVWIAIIYIQVISWLWKLFYFRIFHKVLGQFRMCSYFSCIII